jgi:hypothetical protein
MTNKEREQGLLTQLPCHPERSEAPAERSRRTPTPLPSLPRLTLTRHCSYNVSIRTLKIDCFAGWSPRLQIRREVLKLGLAHRMLEADRHCPRRDLKFLQLFKEYKIAP